MSTLFFPCLKWTVYVILGARFLAYLVCLFFWKCYLEDYYLDEQRDKDGPWYRVLYLVLLMLIVIFEYGIIRYRFLWFIAAAEVWEFCTLLGKYHRGEWIQTWMTVLLMGLMAVQAVELFYLPDRLGRDDQKYEFRDMSSYETKKKKERVSKSNIKKKSSKKTKKGAKKFVSKSSKPESKSQKSKASPGCKASPESSPESSKPRSSKPISSTRASSRKVSTSPESSQSLAPMSSSSMGRSSSHPSSIPTPSSLPPLRYPSSHLEGFSNVEPEKKVTKPPTLPRKSKSKKNKKSYKKDHNSK